MKKIILRITPSGYIFGSSLQPLLWIPIIPIAIASFTFSHLSTHLLTVGYKTCQSSWLQQIYRFLVILKPHFPLLKLRHFPNFLLNFLGLHHLAHPQFLDPNWPEWAQFLNQDCHLTGSRPMGLLRWFNWLGSKYYIRSIFSRFLPFLSTFHLFWASQIIK